MQLHRIVGLAFMATAPSCSSPLGVGRGSGGTAAGGDATTGEGGAKKLGQTSRQDAAAKEVVQFVGHEAGQGPAIGLVGPLLLEGQQVLLDYLEKRGVLGFPGRSRNKGPLGVFGAVAIL